MVCCEADEGRWWSSESDNNTTVEQFLFRCHQTTQVLSTHKILFNSNIFDNIVRGSVILFDSNLKASLCVESKDDDITDNDHDDDEMKEVFEDDE